MSDEFVGVHNQLPCNSSADNLPTYTLEGSSEQSLEERIAATPDLTLPILSGKNTYSQNGSPPDEAALLARDICAAFHAAVTNNQDDAVTTFVSRGYISPDAPDMYLETPLLAAARCGHVGMVRTLVALGARVDTYGQSATAVYERGAAQATRFQRTPLQYAAESGRLAVVRVLVEECGADDGLVAPDGALALRLAADNGHREIVDYLPARRGGGWRRWRVKHEKHMRRIERSARKIGQFLYYMLVAPPKLLLWYVPKWAWENRVRIGGWMKKKVLGIPKVLMKVPRYAWKGIKEIPEVCGHAAKAMWRMVCGVPKVLELMFRWIRTGLVRVGHAITNSAKKIASVVHTAACAVLSFLQRITLRDIWQGVVMAAHSIFIDLPQTTFKFVIDAGEVMYKCLKILFGSLGQCVYYSGVGILWVLTYVPKKLLDIMVTIGRSIANTVEELMVHLNPKRI